MNDRIKTLKNIGLKVTPQRLAILQLLNGNKSHPSAENIYVEVLKEYPSISFATVYNTVTKLAGAGEIQELDIDPEKKRFDPCTEPHSHFYCKACGNVFDISCDSPFQTFPRDIKTIDEHQVDVVQINYKGLCKNCAHTQ